MPTTNLTQSITRQQLARELCICTKTLSRFLIKSGIKIEARCLIKYKEAQLIIQKYQGTE
jgi:hypothetical protein